MRLPIVVERVPSGSTPLDTKDPGIPERHRQGCFATPDEGLSQTQRHEGASGGISDYPRVVAKKR